MPIWTNPLAHKNVPAAGSKPPRKSTRDSYYERARQLRPRVLAARAKIPWVFGTNTYVYAAIAANGGILRQTDIGIALGPSATHIAEFDARHAGMLRTFRLRTAQGRGPRGLAMAFDETFPLAREVLALARKIGRIYPLPIENNMPKETPPRPSQRQHRIDLIAGSEVNTLVLATTRALRGKVGRVELEASVPHGSLTAVERSVARLRAYGILEYANGKIYFKDAPWKRQLENLYDAYLSLRPEIRQKIAQRCKAKRNRRKERHNQGFFGYQQIERALTALAVHGPMPRTQLASVTMLTHDDTAFNLLVDAGVVAIEQRRGSRANVWVSLNAAFPAYRELRATLLALAGEINSRVSDLSAPRDTYRVSEIFNTLPLFWALLMMNAVPDGEIDVASLNRLRAQHAPFTLHGRMHWLEEQGIVTKRRQGLVLYYGLNQAHRAHRPLKRLLNRIGKVWPDMVAAARFNDDLKPARRLVKDRNAKARARTAHARRGGPKN